MVKQTKKKQKKTGVNQQKEFLASEHFDHLNPGVNTEEKKMSSGIKNSPHSKLINKQNKSKTKIKKEVLKEKIKTIKKKSTKIKKQKTQKKKLLEENNLRFKQPIDKKDNIFLYNQEDLISKLLQKNILNNKPNSNFNDSQSSNSNSEISDNSENEENSISNHLEEKSGKKKNFFEENFDENSDFYKNKKLSFTEQEKLNRRYEKIISNLEIAYKKSKEKYDNVENLTNFLLLKMEKRITEILNNWNSYKCNLENKKNSIFEKTKEIFLSRLKNDFTSNFKDLKFLINPHFEEDKKKDKRGRKKKSEEDTKNLQKKEAELNKINYISESHYRFRKHKVSAVYDNVDFEMRGMKHHDNINKLLNKN